MEDPDLFEFRALLYRTSHAQRQLMHPFMASVGLGTGQPRLLSYLEENGSSSPRDLAEYYELDPAGVSRMLDALSKKGLVAIAPAADDRRSKVVSLTAEGKRVSQSWSAACREEAAAMLEGFTPEERAAFADFLVRAHANLRAYGRKLAGEEPRPATERLAPMPAGEEPRPATERLAPMPAGEEPRPTSALRRPSAPEEASHA